MKNTIYHLHAISSLHVGTGQGIGVIDMPIARERASNLPMVPGSGIKGVLRDEMRPDNNNNGDDYLALFGHEVGNSASEFAGALAVGDARLLALPIRSWSGTFAWATCPMILQRYQRDLKDAGVTEVPEIIPTPANGGAIIIQNDSALKEGDKVFLEDLDLTVANDDTNTADEWATFIADQIFNDEWQALFKNRFVILSDNSFDFLSETATEIRARIQIKEDTRTVKDGALWYEEYLPPESLLWGNIAADRPRNTNTKTADELLNLLRSEKRLQIGGNATVGAGQVRWLMPSGTAENGQVSQ